MFLHILGFIAAAAFEIAGCWFMLKYLGVREYSTFLTAVTSLVAFAMLVSVVDVGAAGRTYAIYGGIYIAAAFAFFWATEGQLITRWDIIGVLLSLAGSATILIGTARG